MVYSKIEPKDKLLPTHNVDVGLLKNTRYLSLNPVSRVLMRNFINTLIEFIQTASPFVILDIGCGEGVILRQLNSILPDMKLYGLDIDVGLLHVAQNITPNSQHIMGSIYRLPIPNQFSDLVICTEVLEHLCEPKQALIELVRVTKQYCLLSVPYEPWWRAANMARGKYWSEWGNTPGHLNHWTKNEFVDLISQYMHVIAVSHPFPWTIVLGEKV